MIPESIALTRHIAPFPTPRNAHLFRGRRLLLTAPFHINLDGQMFRGESFPLSRVRQSTRNALALLAFSKNSSSWQRKLTYGRETANHEPHTSNPARLPPRSRFPRVALTAKRRAGASGTLPDTPPLGPLGPAREASRLKSETEKADGERRHTKPKTMTSAPHALCLNCVL